MRGRFARRRAARALREPDPKDLARPGLAKKALEILDDLPEWKIIHEETTWQREFGEPRVRKVKKRGR